MNLKQKSNSPIEPTSSPSTTAATDNTSTVVDDQRKDQSESNHSLPNQSNLEVDIPAPLSPGGGEIESDSDCNVQQSDKNPFSSEMNHVRHLYRKYYPKFTKPIPDFFNQTLNNTDLGIKKDKKYKLWLLMIQYFKLRSVAKDCINTTLGNVFTRLGIKTYQKYAHILRIQLQDFNRLYSWDLSLNEYEAHLIHTLRTASDVLDILG